MDGWTVQSGDWWPVGVSEVVHFALIALRCPQYSPFLNSFCFSDDMGMGKTYQTLTLLGGLFRAKTIRNALVLAPLSVLESWEYEAREVFTICSPNVHIQVIHGDVSRGARYRHLHEALTW